jgi:hypothetical protein
MVANTIIKSIFVICVTALAIAFNNIDLLWWFVLLPFMGYGYKESNEGGEQ